MGDWDLSFVPPSTFFELGDRGLREKRFNLFPCLPIDPVAGKTSALFFASLHDTSRLSVK